MSTKFRCGLCFKAVAVLLGCWLLTCAAAQERGRFGVGFSTGVPRPLAAVSLSADLTDAVTLTGIIGPFGSLSSCGLGLFGPEGFGETPPTVLTFGGGAGLEFPT